jgi:uncharacterized protein YndB with AHSA1/START domain
VTGHDATAQGMGVKDGANAVIVERDLPHPPEKVWRALTRPDLVERWLPAKGFGAEMGHRFNVRIAPRPDRSFAFECAVIAVDPYHVLVYSWDSIGDDTGGGLRSTVTWRLTPLPNGTRLRMEQTGFRPDQRNYHYGASLGWPGFLANLEGVLEDSVWGQVA